MAFSAKDDDFILPGRGMKIMFFGHSLLVRYFRVAAMATVAGVTHFRVYAFGPQFDRLAQAGVGQGFMTIDAGVGSVPGKRRLRHPQRREQNASGEQAKHRQQMPISKFTLHKNI